MHTSSAPTSANPEKKAKHVHIQVLPLQLSSLFQPDAIRTRNLYTLTAVNQFLGLMRENPNY